MLLWFWLLLLSILILYLNLAAVNPTVEAKKVVHVDRASLMEVSRGKRGWDPPGVVASSRRFRSYEASMRERSGARGSPERGQF